MAKQSSVSPVGGGTYFFLLIVNLFLFPLGGKCSIFSPGFSHNPTDVLLTSSYWFLERNNEEIRRKIFWEISSVLDLLTKLENTNQENFKKSMYLKIVFTFGN